MTNGLNEAARPERAYLSPEIVQQRLETLRALNPRPGERVLDAGCGPGLLAAALGEQVTKSGSVLAVDRNPDMLAIAARRCGRLPNVTLREADINALKLEAESFDAVACTQVLLYIDDVPDALSKFRRALKPGGRLAVLETDWRSCVLSGDDPELIEAMIKAWDEAVPSPNLPPRLAPMLRAAGFQAVRVEPIPILNTSLHPDAYSWDMLHTFAARAVARGRLSDEGAARWRRELECSSEQGGYFFCVNRFLFSAVRAAP